MSLAEVLHDYVAACFTGLWIQSHEHADAILEISQLCRDHQWQLATWNLHRGLGGISEVPETPVHDPLSALQWLDSPAPDATTRILVLENFHHFTGSAEISQALAQQILQGRQTRSFIVILSPVIQIPTELEKLFTVIEHQLPTREQLLEIARGLIMDDQELPEDDSLSRLLDAASGLTRIEAENAFSLSLVRDGSISPAAVWELKTQTLKQSGLVQLYQGREGFESLGGLQALKDFCRRSLTSRSATPAKGVLLLGVPGTGKSAFAKSLGTETGRPVLVLDIGALMAGLVGQTEHNIRQALRIADAMEPAILFLDEVEKALSGVASSGQTDSGVTSRLFGTVLTWLNDHPSDVYVIATCNDISKLPPEFSRSERFDGIVFLDLPGRDEKDRIWRLYRQQFGLTEQPLPEDPMWTGAEIKSCCRLASLLGQSLLEASTFIVPVAVTASEQVEKLRTWASGRCLDAQRPGIYQAEPNNKRRRAVTTPNTNPSLN